MDYVERMDDFERMLRQKKAICRSKYDSTDDASKSRYWLGKLQAIEEILEEYLRMKGE